MSILIANHVTNNHLKNVIKDVTNFMTNSSEIPPDMLFDLVNEMSVSNLIVPATIEGDFINFKHLTLEDGSEVIGLFTDFKEFSKLEKDYDPIANQFPFYVELVKSHGFKGIIINPKTHDFFMDMHLISKIPQVKKYSGDVEGYSAEKIMEIGESLTNDSLVEFIRKDSNLREYDRLISEIEKSTLLNVVSNPESLDGYVKNGMISASDVGGFALSIVNNRFDRYVALFTSKSAITDTCDMSEATYYYQVCDLPKVLEFVLYNDMSGAILNPGLDDYFIPRNVLLRLLNGGDIYDDNLRLAVDYAFIL